MGRLIVGYVLPGNVVGIRAQPAPTDKDVAIILKYGHGAPINAFHVSTYRTGLGLTVLRNQQGGGNQYNGCACRFFDHDTLFYALLAIRAIPPHLPL